MHGIKMALLIALFALTYVALVPQSAFAFGASEDASSGQAAQDSDADFDSGRLPLLFLFSAEGVGEAHLQLLRRSAAASLAAVDSRVRLLTDTDTAGASAPRIRAREAEAVGWTEIRLAPAEDERIEITFVLTGVSEPEPFAETTYIDRTDSGTPTYRRIWRQASEAFADALDDLRASLEQEERTARVRLRGVPGTEVLGLAEKPYTMGTSGIRVVTVPAPSTYSIEARAPGYRHMERIIWISGAAEDRRVRQDVELAQEERSLYSFDLALEQLAFPAFEVTRRLGGDYLFARAGLTTYLVGIAAFEDDWEARQEDRLTYFSSDPLTVFRAGLGTYVQPRYRRARAYLSAGLLWRQVHSSGNFGGDPVASWGIPLSLGLETRPEQEWKLFFEWHPTLYFSDYPELTRDIMPGAIQFGDSVNSGDDFILDPLSDRAPVLSLGAFRIGIRRQP